jgi:cytochrome b subunit of formate dehydrogenase
MCRSIRRLAFGKKKKELVVSHVSRITHILPASIIFLTALSGVILYFANVNVHINE